MNLLYIIVTMSVCEVSLRRKCSVGDTQGGLKFRLLNSGICVSPGSSRLLLPFLNYCNSYRLRTEKPLPLDPTARK